MTDEPRRRSGPGCCFAVTILGGATLVAAYLAAPPAWRVWEAPDQGLTAGPEGPGGSSGPPPEAGATGPTGTTGQPPTGPTEVAPPPPADRPPPALPPGPVRVRLRGGGVLEGTLEREEPDALHLRIPGQGKMTLPRARVLEVESLAKGVALVQAAVAAADRGDDALARRLFERALSDPDPQVRGRARSQLDAWQARQEGSPGPRPSGVAAPSASPARPAAPPPSPAPVNAGQRLDALQGRATALPTGVHWSGHRIAGATHPGLPDTGDVFELQAPAAGSLGVIALADPEVPFDPQLQVFDGRGRPLVAGEQGLDPGAASLVVASVGGPLFLFVGGSEGVRYQLLVAPVVDLTGYDRSTWLRDGGQATGQFRPASPELDGRPVQFYSYNLKLGQRANVWARGGATRLFTRWGIPVPDGRAIYDGTYHVAVLGPGPVDRGKLEFTVGLQVERAR